MYVLSKCYLSKVIICLYLCGSISRFCSIPIISMHIPCQVHTVLIIPVYFFKYFNIRVNPPTECFFFKISFVILIPLFF